MTSVDIITINLTRLFYQPKEKSYKYIKFFLMRGCLKKQQTEITNEAIFTCN